MIPLLAVLIPAAFVFGFALADCLRRDDAEWAAEQALKLAQENARIRARSLRNVFDRIEAEAVADRVMAEWITRHPEDRFDMNPENRNEA